MTGFRYLSRIDNFYNNMDCIKYLNSYDEIAELVSQVQMRRIANPFIMEHYRGQGRPEYQLVPTISRGISDPAIVAKKEDMIFRALEGELQAAGLHDVLRMDPNLSNDQNKWNILIQSQHLGAPTRLLDWTLKWEMAVWFAVENPKNDDVDGQFWVYSVPNDKFLNDAQGSRYYEKDLVNLDNPYFLNAPIYWSDEIFNQNGEIKRFRQHGKFSISPYEKAIIPLEEQQELIPHLEKYGIPAAIKGQLRLELAAKGIHDQFVYYKENNNHPTIESLIQNVRTI